MSRDLPTVREYIAAQIQRIPLERPPQMVQYNRGLGEIIGRLYCMTQTPEYQEELGYYVSLFLNPELVAKKIATAGLSIPYCPLFTQFLNAYTSYLRLTLPEAVIENDPKINQLTDLGTQVGRTPQARKGDIKESIIAGVNTAVRTSTILSACRYGFGSAGEHFGVGEMSYKLASLHIGSFQVANTLCGLEISTKYDYNFNLIDPKAMDGIDQEVYALLKSTGGKTIPGKCPATIAQTQGTTVAQHLAEQVDSLFRKTVLVFWRSAPSLFSPQEQAILEGRLPRIDLDGPMSIPLSEFRL